MACGSENVAPEDSCEGYSKCMNEALDSIELVRLFRTGSLDVDGVLKRLEGAQPGDELLSAKEGKSILCSFAVLGSYEICKRLWDKGIRPKSIPDSGCTILHCAVRTYPLGSTNTRDQERAKLLRLFLAAEDLSAMPINSINMFGWTALKMAVRLNLEECAEVLLEHGADVHLAGKEGNYPLHDAVGNHSILKLVLKADPEAINVRNREGNTALMMALKRGDLASCQYLLEGKADTNIANNEGE